MVTPHLCVSLLIIQEFSVIYGYTDFMCKLTHQIMIPARYKLTPEFRMLACTGFMCNVIICCENLLKEADRFPPIFGETLHFSHQKRMDYV